MTPYEIKQMEDDILYIKDNYDLSFVGEQVHRVMDELERTEDKNKMHYTSVFSLPDDDMFLVLNVLKSVVDCYYYEGQRILLYPITKLIPILSH